MDLTQIKLTITQKLSISNVKPTQRVTVDLPNTLNSSLNIFAILSTQLSKILMRQKT